MAASAAVYRPRNPQDSHYYRYLDCGNLHNGFARVKCKDYGHEYLLAFSCKRRHFCSSCHACPSGYQHHHNPPPLLPV